MLQWLRVALFGKKDDVPEVCPVAYDSNEEDTLQDTSSEDARQEDPSVSIPITDGLRDDGLMMTSGDEDSSYQNEIWKLREELDTAKKFEKAAIEANEKCVELRRLQTEWEIASHLAQEETKRACQDQVKELSSVMVAYKHYADERIQEERSALYRAHDQVEYLTERLASLDKYADELEYDCDRYEKIIEKMEIEREENQVILRKLGLTDRTIASLKKQLTKNRFYRRPDDDDQQSSTKGKTWQPDEALLPTIRESESEQPDERDVSRSNGAIDEFLPPTSATEAQKPQSDVPKMAESKQSDEKEVISKADDRSCCKPVDPRTDDEQSFAKRSDRRTKEALLRTDKAIDESMRYSTRMAQPKDDITTKDMIVPEQPDERGESRSNAPIDVSFPLTSATDKVQKLRSDVKVMVESMQPDERDEPGWNDASDGLLPPTSETVAPKPQSDAKVMVESMRLDEKDVTPSADECENGLCYQLVSKSVENLNQNKPKQTRIDYVYECMSDVNEKRNSFNAYQIKKSFKFVNPATPFQVP